MIAMYKAILFDFDDTLISLLGCEAEALRRTLDEAGLLPARPRNFADTFAAISSGYWAARTVDGNTQLTREVVAERTWRDFLRHFGLDASRSAPLGAQYWKAFCASKALLPDAIPVLGRLQERYRLGMITNGYSDSQRGRLEAAGLQALFDPILISEEVGIAKPDAQIFDMALTHLRLPPDAVLYVGDSLSHDREGCRRAGIDFCHFCPDRQARDLPPVKYRIAHLRELIPILLPDALNDAD